MHGFSGWEAPWGDALEISVGSEQGREFMVAKLRNMALMHAGVPDKYKPIALALDGSRAAFPPPTMRLRFPRNLRKRGANPPRQLENE